MTLNGTKDVFDVVIGGFIAVVLVVHGIETIIRFALRISAWLRRTIDELARDVDDEIDRWRNGPGAAA
ncbi:MAG: hypothetical protein JO197_03705 [Acidobacteria bacterium]|nr:hypothetical protein [Acidobacteriota bacterium]MBV9476510.1 hypothetical protein [Acidobacteriota bacterium]